MRFRWPRDDVVFVAFVSIALVTLIVSLGLRLFGMNNLSRPRSWTIATTVIPTSKVILEENAHLGTNDWQIPYGRHASTQIQAYASATSVSPGQTLTFYVSTQQKGTRYRIDIYRLGWYGGYGGRLVVSQRNQIGQAQGYYDESHHSLLNCSSCYVDTKTGLVEANWQPSYTITVPSDWTTGIFLAKFTDANDLQTYVPFDVRGNLHSLYVAVTPDTTYAAYNTWGGYSLYESPKTNSLGRGVKVSFNRPYVDGYGSGQVLQMEADAIHWLERQGYDLSYISDVDLHEDPARLLQHRAYLSLGHDEYWTKEMRYGVEHARDLGVGLAFMGANVSYWQMRFEPDSKGTPDRTVVCYKVDTKHNDLADDPLDGKDNSRVTALWRDHLIARPENALVGIMFSSLVSRQRGFPWRVSPTAQSPLLDGTDLQPGKSYGCGLVGYEWDEVFANGATPAGLQILGNSPTVDNDNTPDISNTAYYIAPSGALVFATGSIYWTASLDSYRLYTDETCAGRDSVVPGMQKLMANVMYALLINHPFQKEVRT